MPNIRWVMITAALLALPAVAIAQQIGYGFGLVVPLVADTPSYKSEILVHNPSTALALVSFVYVGATSSATPGIQTCSTLQIPAGNVARTSLTELCPSMSPGSNFGALDTVFNGFQVAIYVRTQAPSGNGFSVEAIGNNCCQNLSEVIGLARQAAAPTYQSNCFVQNREDRAGRLVVTLATADGQAIVSQLLDIRAREMIRMLDVFAALDAPVGDYVNVRASFESLVPVTGGAPVIFLASCTVQNNTSFDADFRLAKFH